MTANDTDEIFEDVPTEVNDSELQELALPRDVVAATRQAWEEFLGLYDSGVACGEAIYAAIFDSSPSLQSLFKIPRAIMAVRFLQATLPESKAFRPPILTTIFVESPGC